MKKSGDQIRHGLIWVFLGFGFECSLFSSHPGSFCLTDRQTDRQSPGQRAGLFREHDFLLVFIFVALVFNHALLFVTNLSLTFAPYWVGAEFFIPPKIIPLDVHFCQKQSPINK
jgi:hypothetical protein